MRTVSSPAPHSVWKAPISSACSPGSITLVIPAAWYAFTAAPSASASRARVGRGSSRAIRPNAAAPMTWPLSSPPASRT